MTEPNYSDGINRILQILKGNENFAKKIKTFRFGELPETTVTNNYPTCFVTTASNPQVFRSSEFPANSINTLPSQKIQIEYWIVLIAQSNQAKDTQAKLYELQNDVTSILSRNIQLRDTDGNNPLCQTLEIDSISRLTKSKGKIVDAITVMVRCTYRTQIPA